MCSLISQYPVSRAGGGGKSTFSRKSWKERWFVLKGGKLTYHKSVTAPALGEISMADVIDVCASDVVAAEVREFSVVTPERTYYLRCHTPKDCQVTRASSLASSNSSRNARTGYRRCARSSRMSPAYLARRWKASQ